MRPAHNAMHEVVAGVLRKAPLSAEKVTLAWRLAVGPALARVTRVRLGDDGVLVVEAADAHWQKEVRRAAHMILPRLEEMLGEGTARRLEVTK